MWCCFFFTLLSYTSTPVSRFCFIDLDPAAVFVPVVYFFDTKQIVAFVEFLFAYTKFQCYFIFFEISTLNIKKCLVLIGSPKNLATMLCLWIAGSNGVIKMCDSTGVKEKFYKPTNNLSKRISGCTFIKWSIYKERHYQTKVTHHLISGVKLFIQVGSILHSLTSILKRFSWFLSNFKFFDCLLSSISR